MVKSWIAAAVLLLGAGGPGGQAPPPNLPPAIAYGKARHLADLANRRVNESSGLACSRIKKDLFWTHNDSGDLPRVYAFDREGKARGVFQIPNVKARDWEDMASFRTATGAYLVLADVGDNQGKRKSCTIYLAKEPALARPGRAVGKLDVVRTIRFKYADGPRNCEAVAVDPASRTIYLIGKTGRPPCGVYALPIAKKGGKALAVARRIAALNVPVVTAMDISPDGQRCIVLTYGPAVEYRRAPGETWQSAFKRPGRTLGMPHRRQGESICYGPDGKGLYLTSEGAPAPLWSVPPVDPKQPDDAKKAEGVNDVQTPPGPQSRVAPAIPPLHRATQPTRSLARSLSSPTRR